MRCYFTFPCVEKNRLLMVGCVPSHENLTHFMILYRFLLRYYLMMKLQSNVAVPFLIIFPRSGVHIERLLALLPFAQISSCIVKLYAL